MKPQTMTEPKNKQKLAVHPTPFKSSHLAIPPSPFSPRTPLALNPHSLQHRTKIYPAPNLSEPPPSPLQWLWQCHQCRRTYSLGVTRRCLDDGHYFCAGAVTVKTWRKSLKHGKAKRHKACASEFDYQGWKTWGRWRRSGRKDSIYDESSSESNPSTLEEATESDSDSETIRSNSQRLEPVKDCWGVCDYPSECRWGKRYGIHTPVTTEFPTIEIQTTTPPPLPMTFEGVLKPENCKEIKTNKKVAKTDLWDALIANTTRRKSIPPSSPLASVSEEPEWTDPPKDKDGDVLMTTIDPAVILQQPCTTPSTLSSVAVALTASAPVATLRGLIRKSSKIVAKSSKPPELKEQDQFNPIFSVPLPEAALDEFDFRLASREDLTLGLVPLKSVGSRDSGYHSTLSGL